MFNVVKMFEKGCYNGVEKIIQSFLECGGGGEILQQFHMTDTRSQNYIIFHHKWIINHHYHNRPVASLTNMD